MNKDLFLKIIVNVKVLKKIIFNNVYQINKLIISKRIQPNVKPNDRRDKRYRWNDLIESPLALSGNGYLHLLKQYYNKYPLPSGVLKSLWMTDNIKQFCHAAIQIGSLDIIKFFLEDMNFVRRDDIRESKNIMKNLIFSASLYKKIDIFHYLLVEYKCDTFKWDYIYPFLVSPLINCLETVKLAFQLCPDPVNYTTALDNTATVGNLEILDWLLSNCKKEEVRDHHMLQYASMSGHLHVIEYIIKHNLLPNFDETSPHLHLLDYAVKGNHLELAKYIHSNPILSRYVSGNLYDFSCNTSVEMVQWLHTNRTAESCTTDLMDMAAFHGRLDIIQWLHKNNTTATCTHKAMDSASNNGFLDLVKWLHFNRTEGCTTNAMDKYTIPNDFETIKWLHFNRTEGCTPLAIDYAARYGNFELVKWLHDNRTEGCTRFALVDAITYGHYHIAHWLFENERYCNDFNSIKFFLTHNVLIMIIKKEYNMANFEILRWILKICPLEQLKNMHKSKTLHENGTYWEIINQSIIDKESLTP